MHMRHMKILFIVVAVMVFSGCGVNREVHEAILKESEIKQTKLEEINEELDKADDEIIRLMSAISEKEQQNEELSSIISKKDKQIEELFSREKVLIRETEDMKEKTAAVKKERDYLEKEVERLRLKAGELTAEKQKELAALKNTYNSLIDELEGEIKRGEIKITQVVDRLSVNLVEKILFDSGKADIKDNGLSVLKRLGGILKEVQGKQIRVEGHTDNIPIGPRLKKIFPTNWELSMQRATNVVRYFQEEAGIDPKILSPSGYSKYRPIVSNDTLEGKAQNRRIEIVLLPLDVDRVLEELQR